MPVIKTYESRASDISQLKGLMVQEGVSELVKSKIAAEIHKIKLGDEAESNASYLLSKLVEKHKNSFLLNGLRLDIDGSIAQIDHLILNRFGFVTLFESKNFSTGIKVDDEGIFWRWDGFGKHYVEIPSPIEQSKRHEITLRKAFEKIGYEPIGFAHFVVIDYNAKLIKPKVGFENVCRPDRIEEAMGLSAESTKTLEGLKMIGKLIINKGGLTFEKGMELAEKLTALHSPTQINFRKKFGIPDTDIICKAEDVAQDKFDDATSLSIAKIAKKLGFSTRAFELKLHELDFFEDRDGKNYLTEKGKSAGILFKKGRYGYFFTFPADFSL